MEFCSVISKLDAVVLHNRSSILWVKTSSIFLLFTLYLWTVTVWCQISENLRGSNFDLHCI